MQSCTDVATLVSKFSTYNLSVFVCFKQKTAYETRISDWSSDVCSSDLCSKSSNDSALENRKPCPQRQPSLSKADRCSSVSIPSAMTSSLSPRLRSEARRVGKSVSVRVALGGRRIIKKKTRLKCRRENHIQEQNIDINYTKHIKII